MTPLQTWQSKYCQLSSGEKKEKYKDINSTACLAIIKIHEARRIL